MSITVSYGIMPGSYEIAGDVRSGVSATVDYFMTWADAFTFVEEILSAPTAVKVGGINWYVPYQFPVTFGAGTALYAQSWKIKPCGASGSAIPTGGLAPGEFFTNAVVTVTFNSVTNAQQLSDDPQGLNQLDPSNPITACEQSVEITGKMVTRKGAGFTYTSGTASGKSVQGDIPLVMNEVKLVLKFPRVPYLPWQLVQPYVGKINSSTILQCTTGSLLFEGTGTSVTPGTNGAIQQACTLKFAFNPDPTGTNPQGMSWNNFPCPDGSYAPIASQGSSQPPYASANFANIFVGLSF